MFLTGFQIEDVILKILLLGLIDVVFQYECILLRQ